MNVVEKGQNFRSDRLSLKRKLGPRVRKKSVKWEVAIDLQPLRMSYGSKEQVQVVSQVVFSPGFQKRIIYGKIDLCSRMYP
jgi:hypothetical protein